MKRKIFININLPAKTKKLLFSQGEKWRDFSAIKWNREDNLHVCVLSLGYVEDDLAYAVCQGVREAVAGKSAFDLEFSDRRFFPNFQEARYLALAGKNSPELRELLLAIEKKLGLFVAEKKQFAPQIVLGRVRQKRRAELFELSEWEKKFKLVFSVVSIDVMASHFRGGKNEYVTLESCPLE